MNADTPTNRSRFRVAGRTMVGAAGALVASAGLAFAVNGAPPDEQPPAEVPPVEAPPADAAQAGDEASTAGQEEAEAHHASAMVFSEGIQSWTDCIADNAANTPPEERGEGFDPKEGCEHPATTPSGEPFDPGADDEEVVEVESEDVDAAGGPPEGTPDGPPEDVPAGPPAGTPQGRPASDG